VEYVSTIEHQRLPFFGTQWHPEKPPFEFSDDTIPHTHDAIAVSQHLRRARAGADACSCVAAVPRTRFILRRVSHALDIQHLGLPLKLIYFVVLLASLHQRRYYLQLFWTCKAEPMHSSGKCRS
jgi:hypothetical protein